VADNTQEEEEEEYYIYSGYQYIAQLDA